MALALGIDLGTHSVKMAVLEGSFGRYQLTGYLERPVPQDADNHPDLYRSLAALSDLMEELPASQGKPAVAAAYPAEAASVRKVDLPFHEKGQVEKALPFEVEGMVPFDLDDMVLGSRILSLAPGNSQVLVVMADRAQLAPRLEGLADLGADPKALVLDGEMLAQHGESDGGIQAVIDLGHTRTVMTLVKEGRMLSCRAESVGGRALTLALAKELGVSWEEAERIKHEATIYDSDGGDARTAQVRKILQDALVPLLSNVRATLIAFEDMFELEIDEVLLAGGTASLDGLPAWLSKVLGVPVRKLRVSDSAEEAGEPWRLALVHALARKAAGVTNGNELDFRKDEFAFRGDLASLRTAVGYSAVLAVCFLFAGAVMFTVRTIQLQQQMNELDARIAAAVVETFPDVNPATVTNPDTAQAIMLEKTLATQNRVEALGGIVGGDPPTISILKELSTTLPPHDKARIDVQEFMLTATTLTLKAETDSFEGVSDIESALQQSEVFKQARKGEEKKTREGVRFTVTIPLGEVAENEG